MVRKAFKNGAWRLWSIKRLRKLASLLGQHHGSTIPVVVKQQLIKRSNTLKMLAAWKCRFCWVQVEGHLTHCKGCSRHWRQADQASNPRAASRKAKRSQSVRRSQRRESNSKDVENSEKTEDHREEMVTDKLPWVVNSPQTRATVETSGPESKEAAITEPQMPSTPSEEPDVNQVQHLRALKVEVMQAWGSLPQEMEVKAGVRREGQGPCPDTRPFEQVGKNFKAAQRNRHQTYCDGRELADFLPKGPAEVRAAPNHVSSEQARTGQIIHGKIPRIANGQARDSASIASADTASDAGTTSNWKPYGGCWGRHVGSDGTGCTAVSGRDGTDVSDPPSVRGHGWNPGNLRGSSGTTRCFKAGKEGCAQAIQQVCDYVSFKSGQPSSQAEGGREGQNQSYYVKLVDEVQIQEDDSIQSLLNHGPNLGRRGIVTFCDHAEIREFDPEEITSQVLDDFQTKTMSSGKPRQPYSEEECSKWSEAPCPCDLWCADLHWANSPGGADGFNMQESISEFLAELDRGPEHQKEDIDLDSEDVFFMQAHHQTSTDRINLQALLNVAPVSGTFLVTIWAVEFGMGSPHSTTVRLHRGQENTWIRSILHSRPHVFPGGDLQDSQNPQVVVVVDPQPTPSPSELVSNSHGELNLHVIVDTFSHNSVPILLDRVRQGRWVDRKPYAMRVRTVADMFDRVGWGQDLQNEPPK